MFKPKGPVCQSCGMPLSKDAQSGGTNADGTKSPEYCSHCYESGHFKQPNLTLPEMQTLVDGKMKGMHIPRFLRKWFMKDMPKLKRWQASSTN